MTMEKALPEGWVNSDLTDICTVKTGKVDANHAKEMGKYTFFTCALEPLKADTFSFEGELIILPGNGANVGHVGYFKGKIEAYQRTYVLHNFPIVPRYVYWHLSRNWKAENEEKQFGSATNYIKMGNFEDYSLPLPPLAEQQVVADKLDALLAQVETTKTRLERVPETIKRFRQSVLAAAVSGKLTEEWRESRGQLTTNSLLQNHKPLPRPARWKTRSESFIQGVNATAVGKPESSPVKEWNWVQMVDIAKMESGHTPSRSKPEYWGGDVCWIGIKDANVNHTNTIYDTEQKTNELGLANSASRLLPAGTVCISRTASVGYVVKMGKPMATSQDFVNWVPTEVVNPDWLKWLFVAEKESLFRFGKGSTHTTVYFPEWLSLHVLLPHIEEQTQIVRRVEELFAHADAVEQQAKAALEKVNNLTQSILAKAFRGELTADWRAANPELISGENSAEALLARIREERAAQKPKKRATTRRKKKVVSD